MSFSSHVVCIVGKLAVQRGNTSGALSVGAHTAKEPTEVANTVRQLSQS